MGPADWPRRLPMAVAQVRRGALDAPWSQASWWGVARRSLVMGGFVLGGVITGELGVCVFAAFGALQLGLGEAIVPFRRLVQLVVVMTVLMSAVAFVAMTLGGTWWTVPFLGAVAFVQGGTVAVGLVPRATGMGALAMGVIFAGLSGDPATAAVWLAIGSATQALLWLLLWHRERDMSIRVVLANTIRTLGAMAHRQRVSGRDSNRASAEVDEVETVIRESGIRYPDAALRVTHAVNEVRRSMIAWRVLVGPGYSDRLRVQGRLRRSVVALEVGRLAAVSPDPVPDGALDPVPDGDWPVAQRLERNLHALDTAVEHLRTSTHDDASGAASGIGDQPPDTPPEAGPAIEWWRPGTTHFRHGLRMAVAIVIAQSLSLVLPLAHSFWIPLTCVFVVKPDWSFTVVRSTARLLGNLLAVLLVPVALLATGSSVGLVVVILIMSAVAFRFFTGNYILGSFGIAGTILILDQTLAPDQSLYVSRIVATVIGAVVAIVVSALIPSFRSGQATDLVRDVIAGLGEWTARVVTAVQIPGRLDDAEIVTIGERERNNLIRLRPAVEGALMEPRPRVDPRCLAVALDAAERAHLSLLALTFQARQANDDAGPALDIRADADAACAEFRRAAVALGVAEPARPDTAERVERPATDEERAVGLEAVRLHQAAADLAEASGWIARTQR
ncbi:MAG: FUSC family protein [Candidatus Nanopelagicales bacterium]